MQKVLKRFYLVLSLASVVATTIFFINISSLKESGTSGIFPFIIVVLLYLLTSSSLLLIEHKMFYKKELSYIVHSVILVLFIINFFLSHFNVINIILTVILVLIYLLKIFYYNNIKSKFKVSDFNLIYITYSIGLINIGLINFLTTNYIASIFLLMPLLLVEADIFMKIKMEKENYDYNLIASLALLITMFFLSYYTKLFDYGNYDIFYNLLFPFGVTLITILLINLMKKKVNFIIEVMSIE